MLEQKQGMLRHLWKIMLVDFLKFERNSLVIPLWVENGKCYISSIVYDYFLKQLCHYHLHYVRHYQNCLHTLQLVVAENNCIEQNTGFQAQNYNMLGIALQLSGDHKALMQSLILYPDHKFNTSFKRLSLMSS